ncbi:MAG: Sir2 family NAD-dependent protein deacetylase [Deltaproteobacteria bacterium]|nr:Sir2 family NAD-dependent protein deacetylase [Deltaproteobacteria bacterium]
MPLSHSQIIHQIKTTVDVVFFTGAGISTESGVPDFRSPGGIWTRYQPVYYDDFLSSHTARVRYWTMKKETFELYKSVKPNTGHTTIAEFERRGKLLGLITQNVDGLHEIAGVSNKKTVELHGTDRKVVCLKCWRLTEAAPVFESIDPQKGFDPPVCKDCGGYLKPATISFGQPMPVNEMQQAHEWATQAKVFIVLGSSLQVQPAASIPAIAKESGAFLAIINRDPTPLDHMADFVHHGGIGEFMDRLTQGLVV